MGVVFHIGDFKTGSTTIQAALKVAHDADSEELHYCRSGRGDRYNHYNLIAEIKNENFIPKLGGWQALSEELRTIGSKQAVVSCEAFQGVSPDRIKSTIENNIDTAYTVVVYFRPHISKLVSSYSQRVKTGQTVCSLDEFVRSSLKHGKYEYQKRATRLESLFGDTGLIVRPFVRSELTGGDVLNDFCIDCLGFKTNVLEPYSVAHENVSPSHDILQVVRAYSEQLDTHTNKKLCDNVEQQLFGDLREHLEPIYSNAHTKLGLKEETLQLLREEYMEDALKFDEMYCSGKSVFVDDLMDDKYLSGGEVSVQWDDREAKLHAAYRKVILQLVEETAWYRKASKE